VTKRLKVLISAYACNPFMGSEPGVGWGWISAIAKHHDLWIITEKDENQRDIEQVLQEQPALRAHMKFFFVERKTHPFLWKIWPPSYFWSYRAWQKAAYKLGLQLNRKERFDIVHHLTMVGFREPGYLWNLGVPFVWGPIGGLENTPWRFLPNLGLKGAFYFSARNVINSAHKRFLYRPKQVFRKAHGSLIAATEGIRREIRRWYRKESYVICEIGPPLEIASNYSLRKQGEPLKLTWSGQHNPGKALPILLKAVAALPKPIAWQLDILGSGPCTPKWKRVAHNLQIEGKCKWYGWLRRQEALSVMHKSHVFVITSLKDLTSTVLLEALAIGVPVVCLDHCGFSNVIIPECGIKVPVERPDQVIQDITHAIERLWRDEDYRQTLARGALKRIRDFSWEKKAEKINTIYSQAIAGRQL